MTPSKVLVIDSMPQNVRFYHVLLSHEWSGVQVLTSSTALDGIEMAKQEKPDLVIVEFLNPDVDGFEVIWQLRAADVPTKNPPDDIMGSEVREEGLRLGAVAVLDRPLIAEEFYATIQDLPDE